MTLYYITGLLKKHFPNMRPYDWRDIEKMRQEHAKYGAWWHNTTALRETDDAETR